MHKTHTTFLEIRTAILIAKRKRRDGITVYYRKGFQPGYCFEGTLVPPCPFCGARELLVLFANEALWDLDKLAKHLFKLKHGDVVLECGACNASTTLVDYLSNEDFADVMQVAKGFA